MAKRLIRSKLNTWQQQHQTTAGQFQLQLILSKMETIMTDDKKIKKVGMKDIQRSRV